MSAASAATVITSPISTFASTRVRDGNFDPDAVGSRTLAVTRPEKPALGPPAAPAPPHPLRRAGPAGLAGRAAGPGPLGCAVGVPLGGRPALCLLGVAPCRAEPDVGREVAQ